MHDFDESLPHQIGPYRFVRMLGKGGMGAVLFDGGNAVAIYIEIDGRKIDKKMLELIRQK